MLTSVVLWQKHPYPLRPCDSTYFENQCAIRMGVALERSGVDFTSFRGARCYRNLDHEPRHILRAEELANWLVGVLEGEALAFEKHVPKSKKKRVEEDEFLGRQGIIFIRNGWGAGDHIDVWNGALMKGGSPGWIARGQEVWFWELA